MTSRRAIHLIAVASAATIGLVACGGSDSSSSSQATVEEANGTAVDRSASADDTTCPERKSMAFRGHIMNGLPRGVKLSVPRNEWKCDEWSEVSTPGGVFDGMYLVSGARTPFRLEAGAPDAYFTLRVDGQWMENFTEMTFSGTVRLNIHAGFDSDSDVQDPTFLAAGNTRLTEKWRGSGKCTFLPITTAPSSWSDTPVDQVFDAFANVNTSTWALQSTMFIVDKGRIGLVFTSAAFENTHYLTHSDKSLLCGSTRPKGT